MIQYDAGLMLWAAARIVCLPTDIAVKEYAVTRQKTVAISTDLCDIARTLRRVVAGNSVVLPE